MPSRRASATNCVTNARLTSMWQKSGPLPMSRSTRTQAALYAVTASLGLAPRASGDPDDPILALAGRGLDCDNVADVAPHERPPDR